MWLIPLESVRSEKHFFIFIFMLLWLWLCWCFFSWKGPHDLILSWNFNFANSLIKINICTSGYGSKLLDNTTTDYRSFSNLTNQPPGGSNHLEPDSSSPFFWRTSCNSDRVSRNWRPVGRKPGLADRCVESESRWLESDEFVFQDCLETSRWEAQAWDWGWEFLRNETMTDDN